MVRYFRWVYWVGLLVLSPDLINWIGDLLRPIGDMLTALGKLGGFGDLIGTVTGGGFVPDTGGGGGTLNATFNVYGDPAVMERTIVNTLARLLPAQWLRNARFG